MNQSTLSRPYQALFLLSISHFVVDFMIGIWPIYKTIAGIDLALAGIIYAVSATLGEGMQAVFGNYSDRGWRKTLILSGMALTLVGSLFAFTHNPLVLFFIFLTICLGSGAFHPAAVGLVSQLTSKRKSFYITHFAAFGSLGLATSQIVYANTYEFFDGNTLILMVPTLLLILFAFQRHRLQVPITTSSIVAPPKFRLFLEFFRQRDLKLLYISQICNQTVAWGLIFLLPDILKSRGYDSWIVFGGGHMIYILGGVLLLVPSGLLADKFSSRSVIFGATLTGSLVFYSFLTFPFLSPFAMLSLLFCLGACISVVNPVSIALGNKLAPNHPSMVSAYLMGCVWCVSEFLGPGGGGLLTKLFTDDAPAKALMVLGILFPLGIWSAWNLPAEVAEESGTAVKSLHT